jgi:aminoglycoside N3'-acetyltransferase
MSDSEIPGRIQEMLSRLGSGPVFVHSDPFRAARLVTPARDRQTLIESHLGLILVAASERAVWMPAFNYDFPQTHTFDVRNDPSQLGPITEQFRLGPALWRTEIPIFSASGTGEAPVIEWGEDTDPFGPDSLFANLVELDGVILYYGETFHYNTIVHYAERVAGGPTYRYDKIFEGVVTREDGTTALGSLNYHVRPMGMGLEYDWAAILSRAIHAGVCERLAGNKEVLSAPADALTAFLVDEMRGDPLALLDASTRRWVEPKLQKLGRRFIISDFE